MLTLIDGNSLLFRAYYGVHSRLTRRDGTPTGAVYGFFNMVLPVLAATKPNDSVVCVFDASRITFRQDIYPEYKSNRAETPADLLTQGVMIRDGLADMGIPVLCIPGVEADDVIATLANLNTDSSTRIITSDKDLMQLVNDRVFLYDGMKSHDVREAQVLEKFGVRPDQVVDVQSLMGDSTDNVPGVHGIGPKKAAELINRFGSLDNLYAHIDEIENQRTRDMLRDGREMAYISRQLVTLKSDVDLDGLILSPMVFNTPAALKFVRNTVESASLATKIEKLFPMSQFNPSAVAPTMVFPGSACPTDIADVPHPTQTPDPAPNNIASEYTVIRTVAELDDFLHGVKSVIAFDTETTGLNQMSDKIVGISLATDSCRGAYIPIRHQTSGSDLFATNTIAPNQLDIETVRKHLWPVFTNKNIVKVGHNLKYDLHILENEGWNTSAIRPIDDTMLLSYALHGSLHGHGLDELATKYLSHTDISFSSLFPAGTRDGDKHFDMLPIDTAAPYAAEDASVCFALYELMRPELDANENCAICMKPVICH